MNAPRIIQVALPVPLHRLFDYLPPRDASPPPAGARVLVPFGRRKLVGAVIRHRSETDVPEERLLHVESSLDGDAALLDARMLDLLQWCWQYYKHPPGEVVAGALPPALRQAKSVLPPAPLQYRLTPAGRERLLEPPGRAPVQHAMLAALAEGPAVEQRLADIGSQWRNTLARLLEQDWVAAEPAPPESARPRPGPELLPDQREAVAAVSGDLGGFRCHLLDGITGSGKTEVYLRLLETVLRDGGQALVLVPEIGLTPQLLRRFRDRLGLDPAVIHSGLSAGERLAAWDAARSGRAPLLVGTRSALFTPMPSLQLIVLDEEHDAVARHGRTMPRSSSRKASGILRATSRSSERPSWTSRSCSAVPRRHWNRCATPPRGATPGTGCASAPPMPCCPPGVCLTCASNGPSTA